MDRNEKYVAEGLSALVAPREGCVDRNLSLVKTSTKEDKSHPARGAWIEIWEIVLQ